MFGIFNIALDSDITLPELPVIDEKMPVISVTRRAEKGLNDDQVTWFHHWPDKSGEISISGGHLEEKYLLRFPGLVDFVVYLENRSIVYIPEDGIPESTIRHLLLDQVIPRVLCQMGNLVLHASAIRLRDGTGIGFLGDSGWGKSTLAASFTGKGAKLITDDCLLLDFSKSGLTGIANYYGARLYDDSAVALFEQSHSSSGVAHYTDKKRINLPYSSGPTEQEVKLSALFVLNDPADDSGVSGVTVTPMEGTSGLMAIIRQSFSLDVTDKGVNATLFKLAGNITDLGIEIFSLSYPRQHDCLPQVQNAVVDVLSSRDIIHS
jgi:hypothetical protein